MFSREANMFNFIRLYGLRFGQKCCNVASAMLLIRGESVETKDTEVKGTEAPVCDYFAQAIFRANVALKADSKINRLTGNEFNPLKKYVPWSENTMSHILSDLLNPAGEHGQGELFLRLFVSGVLADASLDCSKAVVQREALTRNIEQQQRRIDILLSGSNWACAIENKPRAGQQEGQLEAYMQQVTSLKKEKSFLVFLAPHHYTPQPFATNREGLRIWELNEVEAERAGLSENITTSFFAWTTACKNECEADNVRHFIADFAEWVDYYIW